MPVFIPEIPAPRPWAPRKPPPGKYGLRVADVIPGEMVFAPPYEAEMFLSFTTPLGKISSVITSLAFQFRKWGYVRYKADEWMFVSHVFKPYYDITVKQREELQAAIKTGLASIATAISDYELVWHDLRKYKEYLDYFTWIDKGKRLIKEGKKEEGEKLFQKGNTTLKSIFIDLVDVHTGEGVALKLIAPRWPTIIVDFLKLRDEDLVGKDIAKKYGVSEAEGVVLATKNKLFLEWRDKMFRPTVTERYKHLLSLAQSRRKSIEEYRNMLRPTVARLKMITDALEKPPLRAAIRKHWSRPDVQAISVDYTLLWAWRPFAISEKYKVTRETFDLIPARKAGFRKAEIMELQDAGLLDKKNPVVFGLPVEPSIDRIVRAYYKGLKPGDRGFVEKEYGVELNAIDLFKARQMLVDQFRASISALTAIEPWVWAPHYIFIEVPISRSVLRLPDGSELEDVEFRHLLTATASQNVIIIKCLELIARDKQVDNYIREMLGEYGVKDETLMEIDKLTALHYPEIPEMTKEWKERIELEKKIEKLRKVKWPEEALHDSYMEIRRGISKFFHAIGLDVQFFRAVGPYEFAMQQRMAKLIQRFPGRAFAMVKDFLKTKFGTPGVERPW